jgi:GAF domain-containing protein
MRKTSVEDTVKLTAGISFAGIALAYWLNYTADSWRDELSASVLFSLNSLLFYYLYVRFVRPVVRCAHNATRIQEGNFSLVTGQPGPVEVQRIDSAFSQLTDTVAKATEFVKSVERGESGVELSGNDALSTALTNMYKRMNTLAQEEKNRNWATEGLAMFVNILRTNNNDVSLLCDLILKNLVKYLEANQAALFVVQDEGQQPYLELMACYAFNRKKYLSKRIDFGEGLAGQACLEKDTIYLTDIPANYVRITSGLGGATPRCVLVIPLKVNDQVQGVLEIASFKEFPAYQIEFLEKLSETIASAIANVKSGEKMRLLLEEFQQQAEEMRAQEEEMRQSMEELQATQEEMVRKQSELESVQAELRNMNQEIEETRQVERSRANAQIDAQKKSMQTALERLKKQEDELRRALEAKDTEIELLKKSLPDN